MAAFEAEPADSWLRRAAFAAAVLDPMVAAAGVLEPAGVADYLGTVAANLSTQGLTISAEGTEVSIEASQGELSMGWPTRLAYDLSGAIVVAPGLLATGPSSGSMAIESAGRLDPTTLLGDGSLAFADAAPFRISARVESEVGHVEGTGTLGVDQYGSPSLVAAEATVTTGDPVGFLNEALLAPMAAQTSDPAALQDALAEVLAALGWLPLQPGQDRDFAIRYDPLTESVTVEGQDLSALLAALGEACSHRGC
jgi:hypothetical protein